MNENEIRKRHRGGEARHAVATLVHPDNGCGRDRSASREPDPDLERRGDGGRHAAIQADQGRRRRPAQDPALAGPRLLLNPHFALGTRTRSPRASSSSRSPAGTRKGNLIPCLAAEVPTKARTAASRRTTAPGVTWKLKRGVTWHDGKPFTADDVRLHLAVCRGSRDRGVQHRILQGHQGREDRRPHRQGESSRARRRSGPTPSARSARSCQSIISATMSAPSRAKRRAI